MNIYMSIYQTMLVLFLIIDIPCFRIFSKNRNTFKKFCLFILTQHTLLIIHLSWTIQRPDTRDRSNSKRQALKDRHLDLISHFSCLSIEETPEIIRSVHWLRRTRILVHPLPRWLRHWYVFSISSCFSQTIALIITLSLSRVL